MKHRLVLAAGAALLLASATGCTGSFDAGPPPSGNATTDFAFIDPRPAPATPLPAGIDAPTLQGTMLWTGTGQPGTSVEGSFDAKGRAILVGLNCEGDGSVTVTLSEGSSYTMPCTAGQMTPYRS